MAAVKLGTFIFDSAEPDIHVEGWLTTAPVLTAGGGGWSRVARPRRKSITEWLGRDSVSLEIEFLLEPDLFGDDPDQGMNVETTCRALESLWGIESSDPEPPVFKVSSHPAPLMPHGQHRASHVRYFIETLAYDKASIIYNREGNRIKAAGTITVTQFVEDKHISAVKKRKARSKKAGKRPKPKHKTHIVKKGETLSRIAANEYGNAKYWKDIAKANHIRDPHAIKQGQHLKLP